MYNEIVVSVFFLFWPLLWAYPQTCLEFDVIRIKYTSVIAVLFNQPTHAMYTEVHLGHEDYFIIRYNGLLICYNGL